MYEIINQRLKSRDPSIAVALYSVHTHCILYILNHGLICFLANSNWQSYIHIVLQGVAKKQFTVGKIFPKLTSGQNSRKLSVSLGSLAPSGTFGTKFILKSVFFRVGMCC